jgi:hypothetical protein
MKSPSNKNSKFSLASFAIAIAAVLVFGSITADAQKTDAVGYKIDQCANGKRGEPKVPCVGNQWQNGNINRNQAQYREGDSVPYRVIITGLTPGTSNIVTIEWDTTKGGFHAIDYITSFNRTETDADPCSGVSGCTLANNTTFPIPPDPNFATNCPLCTQAPGNFTIYNGVITSSSAYTLTGPYTGDSATKITLNFTVDNGSTSVVIAWGGHISSRADWGFDGTAIDISGSPYHMRLKDVTGNQDRSMQLDAIIFAGSLTINKIAITRDGTGSSNIAFPFTTVNSGLGNFSLIDNIAGPNGASITDNAIFAFGAANTITVTEDTVAGWSLDSLVCVESSGGLPTINNSTVNVLARTATIIVEESENVECTFTNGQIAPSAAPASVAGRVATSSGRGISGAIVSIHNTDTGEVHTRMTNTFGYYRFNDLPVSSFYVMTVVHKRYLFMDASRSFTLDEDMFGVDFITAEDK